MKKINLENIKEKFLFYHKQKKFQLSVLDWVPQFDWYFLLTLLCIFLIISASVTFELYKNINNKVDQGPENIIVEKDYVDFNEIQTLVDQYETKRNRLNTLR
jgi:hypothetical protein